MNPALETRNMNMLNAFYSWLTGHRMYAPMWFLTNVLATSLSGLVPALQPYLSTTLLVLILFWLGLGVYFYVRVWRKHFVITTCYGVFREQHRVGQVIACRGDISSVYVDAELGPAVKSWTVRFRVPPDCALTNVHYPDDWKCTFAGTCSAACLSSARTQGEIELKFDITVQEAQPRRTTAYLELEYCVNLEKDTFPCDERDCRQRDMEELLSIPALLIPAKRRTRAAVALP